MTPGASVRVEYPGHALHRRLGKIVEIVEDDFLGTLYAIETEDGTVVALPARYLRPVIVAGAAA